MKTELKPLWNRLFKFDWVFGLALVLAVCVPRFILVLDANKTANYSLIGLIMLVSAIIPFVFLSKYGRNKIGIKKPTNYRWLVYSFLIGILISTAIFLLGKALYADTFNNWYVYIGQSHKISEG